MNTLASIPQIEPLALLWRFTYARGGANLDLGIYPHLVVTLEWIGYPHERFNFGLN